MPWRNGRGTTHEIAREPDAPAEFVWRLSLADVPASGPFSPFEGYERIVVLVAGEGFQLDFGGHGGTTLTPSARVAQFLGDWPTQCTLLGAPCSDLSFMVRRCDARALVTLLEVGAEQVHVLPVTAVTAFFCVSGALRLAGDSSGEFSLAEWDTALIEAKGERCWRLRSASSGTLVACLSAIPLAQEASAGSGRTS
jgi:uncharacterized protein